MEADVHVVLGYPRSLSAPNEVGIIVPNVCKSTKRKAVSSWVEDVI
jgi:hypothetical protein